MSLKDRFAGREQALDAFYKELEEMDRQLSDFSLTKKMGSVDFTEQARRLMDRCHELKKAGAFDEETKTKAGTLIAVLLMTAKAAKMEEQVIQK